MMKRISLPLIVFILFLCGIVKAATFTVSNNADAGAGSFRQAILDANGAPGADIIDFTGAFTITLVTPLPDITEQVTINGPSTGGPQIEIDGTTNGIAGPGLLVAAGAPGTIIKGLNIHGHSQWGILVAASDFTLAGCYLGTDITGTIDRGNGFSGIEIAGGLSNIRIGGLGADSANVISGNAQLGINFGAGCSNVVIINNKVGLNATGTGAIPNDQNGISITNASGLRMGGTSINERNYISGNSQNGILIANNSSDINIIGNYIGTDINGTTAIGNGISGLVISLSTNVLVGGNTSDSANIIGGNAQNGLVNENNSSNNRISGNYVGIGADGSTAVGNGNHGILIIDNSDNVIVGGSVSGSGNIIGNNTVIGLNVTLNSDNAVISNNIIGLAADGLLPAGNGSHGIQVENNCMNTTIGGATYSEKNVISNNGSIGILIIDCNTVNIEGNFIGTDILGTTERGNSAHGIQLQGANSNIVIGGSRYVEGNIISSNGGAGINFEGSVNGASGTVIKGNLIGTDSTVTQDFGNFLIGMFLKANNCIIGDTANNEGNVIAGSDFFGGILVGNANNSVIVGNYIGVGLDSITDLGNEEDGIAIVQEDVGQSASDNIITHNVIAYNGRHGVNVGQPLLDPPYTQVFTDEINNTIRFNSIFCNTELGISLFLTDPSNQGNNGNPTPQINTAMSTDSMIVGIQDPALANQLIDVYIMVDCPSCDINPQGKIWVDSTQVDGSGNWSYDFGAPIPGSLVVTATDASGNTSQFSTCLDPCSALAVLEANNEVLLGPNDPVTLTLTGSNSQFSPLNPTVPEYYWVVGNDTIATSADTVVTFQYNGGGGNYAEGNYQITLIAQQASCVDTASIDVDAIYFYVPNMITPNGDQINDAFQITTEEGRYNVEIYNRWGKRIYVEEGYTNGWQPGSDVSDGLYYYSIVDPVGSLGEFKGWVYLVR